MDLLLCCAGCGLQCLQHDVVSEGVVTTAVVACVHPRQHSSLIMQLPADDLAARVVVEMPHARVCVLSSFCCSFQPMNPPC